MSDDFVTVTGEHGNLPVEEFEDLQNRFLYHPPPNQARIDAHATVSNQCLQMAIDLSLICPKGRNLSIALTRLEEVRMRANAALACDSPEE